MMKKHFLLLTIWSAFCFSCFGQDWTPFYYSKRIIYGTPDSLGHLLTGQTLAVMRFDTSIISGGKSTMFCKKGLGTDEFTYQFTNSKSLVSLYGKKMVVDGTSFWFHHPVPSGDSILYVSIAETGQPAIISPTINGIVVQKSQEPTPFGLDSVKLISIQESIPGSPTRTYLAKVSKHHGFLAIPALFQNPIFGNLPIYSLIGDYDQDLKKIKSHPNYMNRFQLGDKMIYNRWGGISFNYQWVDSVKSEVISALADSCILLDSVKVYWISPPFSNYPYVRTRKILNTNFNLPENPAGLTIGTPHFWSTTAAMLTKDSLLFIGERPCALGINDGPFIDFRCTQFPISQQNDGNIFYPNGQNPIFFQRGDTTAGKFVSILFTSAKEVISRKVSIYPNPSGGKIWIGGLEPGQAFISIFNVQGVLVNQQAIEPQREIDLRALPDGLYHLQIQVGGKIFKEKILKN